MKNLSVILAIVLIAGLMASVLAAPDDLICPRCGKANAARYKFCTFCGAKLIPPAAPLGAQATASQQAIAPAVVTPADQPAILEVGMSRSFHLRDQNIIVGRIIELQGDSAAIIETADGRLTIPTREILSENVDVVKNDDTHYAGPLLSEDEFSLSLKTPYGIVVVMKKDIARMDRFYGATRVSWQEEKRRFFAGEELNTIFLDPTASPLPEGSLYLSGLSLGYGFTEDFSLSSKFGSNFSGDLNLEPHLRVYHRSTGATDLSLALGVRLHSSRPMLDEASHYSHWIVKESTGKRLDDELPTRKVEDIMTDRDQKEFFWTSYMVMSRRSSLSSGRGKWGLHLGVETNSLIYDRPTLNPDSGYVWADDFDIPYRVWGAWDYDLTKQVKFMLEVFADNGHKYLTVNQTRKTYFDDTPFTLDSRKGEYKPVDFDFGFLWKVNDAFRLGVHFQSPYLAFYWRW